MPQVTISNIAEEAGLSPSSVSRILRGGKGHVYPTSTVERVQGIARRRGYRANSVARMLIQGTQTMIGLSVHFTEHPYLNRFLQAVHQELLAHEYDPVLLDANHLANEGTAQPFPPPHMLAGLISTGIDLQTGWPKHYATLAEHVPIVAVQPVSTKAAAKVDVVQVDFACAYRQALEYLTEMGHRDIAFLGVLKPGNPGDAGKLRGWAEAIESRDSLADNRIPWVTGGPARTVAGGGGDADDFIYSFDSRRAIVQVVKTLTSSPTRITALMCASDEVALAVQSYLQSIGWSLPQDLSIIGYDGISFGEQVYPSLTTIAPNYKRMAEQAVSLLRRRIEEKDLGSGDKPQTILVEPYLRKRESVGPILTGAAAPKPNIR